MSPSFVPFAQWYLACYLLLPMIRNYVQRSNHINRREVRQAGMRLLVRCGAAKRWFQCDEGAGDGGVKERGNNKNIRVEARSSGIELVPYRALLRQINCNVMERPVPQLLSFLEFV